MVSYLRKHIIDMKGQRGAQAKNGLRREGLRARKPSRVEEEK